MASSGEVIKNLQALRVYAAANVVVVHLFQANGSAAPFGLYGVDVFFVLSGFIMARIAARNPEGFLRRRLMRIVPLYWLCTVGVFCIALVKPELLHCTKPNLLNLLKSLLFVPYQKEGGAVQPLLFLGWTLNYEMFFYLVFGLVLRVRPRNPSAWAALGLAALPCIAWIWRPRSVIPAFYCSPIILEFILGIIVYHLSEFIKPPRHYEGWGVAVLALCVVWLPLAEALYGVAYRPWLLGVPAALIVFLAVGFDSQGRAIRSRVVLLAGEASYALYLTHPYVIQAGEKLFHLAQKHNWGTRLLLAALLAGAALLVACLLHLFVEVPIGRVLKRLLLRKAEVCAAPNPAPVATPA